MNLLYYFGIKIYYFLVLVFSLFSEKARLFVRGRRKLFQDLKNKIDPNHRVVWFHCASLGEFEQGRPLIEEIKSRYPDIKILLTFFSPSGYEIRKNYKWADVVTYLPLDTPRNARRFLEIVQPEEVFFIKYEYWYFFLREIKKQNIPVFLVSAIFRKNQFFFKSYGAWFRKVLHYFDHIFVQNNASRKLLADYRINHVTVSGDTRFDRVRKIAENARPIEMVEKFKEDHYLLVAGSTWPKDEEVLTRYFQETSHSLKMIIAPHEVHESRINGLMSGLSGGHMIKYSEADESSLLSASVLVIDSIGLLSSLYRYGDISYVGGGFGKGIHNILEPATFGLPVIFGPNHKKFREALDLKKHGGAFTIEEYAHLKDLMDRFLENPDKISKAGKISRQYVENNTGSTARILLYVYDE